MLEWLYTKAFILSFRLSQFRKREPIHPQITTVKTLESLLKRQSRRAAQWVFVTVAHCISEVNQEKEHV